MIKAEILLLTCSIAINSVLVYGFVYWFQNNCICI